MKSPKFLGTLLICLLPLLTWEYLYGHHGALLPITPNPSTRSTNVTDFHPYIAVLVEFRITDFIVTVVRNVNQHIPLSWPIQIFHGRDNEGFITNSTLAPLTSSGKVFLTLMNVVYDRNKTNALLTDPKFWQRVRGEKILFFQIDSIMCSNSPHKITDFLHYDYIGAPWKSSGYKSDAGNLVGNGGFSLRSRTRTLALLALLSYDVNVPEDVWYGRNLPLANGSVAPLNVAKTFSVESVYYERPLGVHRPFLECPLRKQLFGKCPEAMIVTPGPCS